MPVDKSPRGVYASSSAQSDITPTKAGLIDVQTTIWNQCIQALQADLSEQQINTWIRPLQPIEEDNGLRLLAPNRFIVDWSDSDAAVRP